MAKLFSLAKNNKGFTLIEMMVTVAILVTAILPMLDIMSNNLKNNNDSKEKLVAQNLAVQTFEDLKQRHINNPSIKNEHDSTNIQSLNEVPYQINTHFEEISSGPNYATVKITVKVSWDNNKKVITYSTFFTALSHAS